MTSRVRTNPSTPPRRAALVVAAALLASLQPAAAGAYAAPASQKLASGPQSYLSEANVRQKLDLDPVSWWGHDSLHARYLSSTLGRFVSVDPVGPKKPGASQEWNRYSYVFGNPLKLVDPKGRVAILMGTEEEKRKTLAALRNTLPTDLRSFVRTTINEQGQTVIDTKFLRMGASAASGNFQALRSLASSNKLFGINTSSRAADTSEGTVSLGANTGATGIFLDQGGLSRSKNMSFVLIAGDLKQRDTAVTLAHEMRHAAFFAIGKPFEHELGLFEESPNVFNAYDPKGAVNRATSAAEVEAEANFDPFYPQD